MSNKSYIFALCLAAVLVLQYVCADIETNEVNDEYYMVAGVRVYHHDRQCILLGGLCVQSSDCKLPTTNKGLCPSTTHLGVECCYEFVPKLAPCRQYGAECMDWCNPGVRQNSTDCTDGQFCCILM
ncbi:hypothetical protein KR222_011555 [Zaprionus bogoriensis]|nr:hypothetical protein KR222_011555 [Zaprionus bogoriensis]